MEKLRAAIVGCGNVFVMHAYPITEFEPVELVAVCDIKKDRADWRANEFKCKSYTDYTEMLEKEKLDVLHICLPHYLHAPVTIAALKAGLHVMTEKPMSITVEDAKAMIAAADEAGKLLGVIFQNQYNSGAQMIKKEINGKLGKVIAARCFVTWDRSDEYYSRSDWKGTWDKEGGGVVIDQAIHTLDLCRWMINSPVTTVNASIANRDHHQIEVEDSAEGVIHFECGARAAFFAVNYYSYDAPVEIELHCENGIARMRADSAHITYNDGMQIIADPDPRKTFDYGNVKNYWGVNHITQIHNFYDCIINGGVPDIDGREALKTQEMVCAIYESGKSGKTVTLR
jgi:predicted dehydrogenase